MLSIAISFVDSQNIKPNWINKNFVLQPLMKHCMEFLTAYPLAQCPIDLSLNLEPEMKGTKRRFSDMKGNDNQQKQTPKSYRNHFFFEFLWGNSHGCIRTFLFCFGIWAMLQLKCKERKMMGIELD